MYQQYFSQISTTSTPSGKKHYKETRIQKPGNLFKEMNEEVEIFGKPLESYKRHDKMSKTNLGEERWHELIQGNDVIEQMHEFIDKMGNRKNLLIKDQGQKQRSGKNKEKKKKKKVIKSKSRGRSQKKKNLKF